MQQSLLQTPPSRHPQRVQSHRTVLLRRRQTPNVTTSEVWNEKDHLRHKKWRSLVSQARAAFPKPPKVIEEGSHDNAGFELPKKTNPDNPAKNEEVKVSFQKWKANMVKNKAGKVQQFKPLDCFRRIVRIVRIILRVGNALKNDAKRNLGDGISKSYLEMMEGYIMMKNKTFSTSLPANTGPGLFDPTLFKANREIQISKEVRNILCGSPDDRTTDQLQTLLYACQTLSAFAELPLHMQQSICKVAWYQRVPPNKIIIKQSHLPENFYFIMSGLVTVLSENDPTKDTPFTSLAVLGRGICFGEVAFLKGWRRTATIISKNSVQLLVIGKEDYQSIFMGRSKNGEEPRYIKFCRTLDFLSNFPINLLINNPSNCIFHYFRRGAVVVKDSHNSESVYIVVSGMCEVLLNLEAVTPKLTGKQIDARVSSVEMLAFLTEERYANSQYALSSANKTSSACNKDCKDRRPSSSNTPRSYLDGKDSRTASSPARRTIKSAHSESTLRARRRSIRSEESTNSRDRAATAIGPVLPAKELNDRNLKPTKNSAVLVRIDFLHPRSVFGLSNIDSEDTGESNDSASVSLVSRGAECVVISKRFFVAHAKEPTNRWIRHNVWPYPTKDVLQRNLQQKVNWNAYKQDIIKKAKAT